MLARERREKIGVHSGDLSAMDPGPRALGASPLLGERGSSPEANPQFYLGISTLPRIVCRPGTPLAPSWHWALVGRILGPSRNGVDSAVRFDATGSQHEMRGSTSGTDLQPRNDLPAPSQPLSVPDGSVYYKRPARRAPSPVSCCSPSSSPSPPHFTLVQFDLQRLSLC